MVSRVFSQTGKWWAKCRWSEFLEHSARRESPREDTAL